MVNSKIDWCDSTWNPVTGCLHGCEYCYARGIANRFKGYEPEEALHEFNSPVFVRHRNDDGEWGKEYKCVYPYGFDPTLHRYHLNDYIGKKGRNIFVCSMADLFGKWVPDNWIEEVFKACEKAPQHNYLFLTKNPQRYVDLGYSGKLPEKDNMWYGSTVTTPGTESYWGRDTNTFWSIEPILEPFGSMGTTYNEVPKWIIIGAETGQRKNKVIPERKWIEDILNECRKADIPVFMKSSLAEIWEEPLIQEFPKVLLRTNYGKC